MKKWTLLLTIGAIYFPIVSTAQTIETAETFKPYIQVKSVAGDEKMVRAFFTPSCSYSKAYFRFFKNLQGTMPSNKGFEFTPVVTKTDGLSYAMSYAAVQKYYPTYLNNFIEASFMGVQDKGISTGNWRGIDRIGRAAGVPVSIPQLVKDHSKEIESRVGEFIQLQHNLHITNTPSVSISGTYIVTPEFTNGDMAMFSQLVNGLISMTN